MDRADSPAFNPYWVQEQFEMVQSKSVLYPVVTKLNLTNRWEGRIRAGVKPTVGEIFSLLKSDLEVRQYRGTSLIEISVSSRDRTEAAEIANAVAASFAETKLAERQSAQARGIKGLEEELQDQQEKLLLIDREVDKLQTSGQTEGVIQKKKKEAEAGRLIAQRLTFRIQQESNTRITSGVQLLDPATPPLKPVRPSHTLIATLLGSGIFCGILGTSLLLYSRKVQASTGGTMNGKPAGG